MKLRPAGDALLLDLSGPLGKEGGDAIVRTVEEQSDLPQRLVFNFTRVPIMNTAGLGGVLWAVRLATRAGRPVFAYGLTDHFRKVFHVMGLTRFVAVVEDEAAALADGGGAGP